MAELGTEVSSGPPPISIPDTSGTIQQSFGVVQRVVAWIRAKVPLLRQRLEECLLIVCCIVDTSLGHGIAPPFGKALAGKAECEGLDGGGYGCTNVKSSFKEIVVLLLRVISSTLGPPLTHHAGYRRLMWYMNMNDT